MTIDAITTEFMLDFDAHTLEDAAMWVANLDVVDDLARDNDDNRVKYRGMNSPNRLGLQASRNFFIWYAAPTDNYNVSRIDFNKGSNSVMHGDSLPGGVPTVYTKQARFNNFGSFLAKYASEDTYRVQLDVNRMINEKLAVRLNLVQRADRRYIDFTDTELKAISGAVTYKPFKNTIIRFEAESGKFARSRGRNDVRIRSESAEGRGFDRIDNRSNGDRWYVTSDGDIFKPNGEIFSSTSGAGDLDYDVDRQSGGGPTHTLLEGQTKTVRLKDRVGGSNIFTGETVDITGFTKSFNIRGENNFLDRPYTNATLWVEQRFGDLNLEFAYNQQNQFQNHKDSQFSQSIRFDSDGRPYTESDIDDKKFGNRVKTVRATASYPFKLGDWMQQFVVATGTYQEDFVYTTRLRLINIVAVDNPEFTDKRYSSHRIRLRAYLDDPAGISSAFWQQFNLESLPDVDGFRPAFYEYTTGNRGPFRKRYQKTFSVSASGNYFNGRFRTLLGVRKDSFVLKRLTDIPTGQYGEIIILGDPDSAPEAYEYVPEFDLSNTALTTGLVVRLTPSINVYGVVSESFQWQGATHFAGGSLGPVIGETREIGLKGSLFDNTLFFTLAAYKIDRENTSFRLDLNGMSADEVEDLFNAEGSSSFVVSRGLNQEHRTISSTELAEGFEATLLLKRIKGIQARLTFAQNDITSGRDIDTFKTLLAAAIARGDEDPDHIADAQDAVDDNDGVFIVDGSRSVPYSVNWAFDYQFGENTFLKNTRLAIYGNWRDNYTIDIEDGVGIHGGARHPVSLYIIHRRMIRDYNVSFRLGIKNVFDLENNEDFREINVTSYDDDGVPLYRHRYISPTTVNFTVNIGF